MKQWRREAAAVKRRAISGGNHIRGQRYGKALRDVRRGAQVQGGMVYPLLAALLIRFAQSWIADPVVRTKKEAA